MPNKTSTLSKAKGTAKRASSRKSDRPRLNGRIEKRSRRGVRHPEGPTQNEDDVVHRHPPQVSAGPSTQRLIYSERPPSSVRIIADISTFLRSLPIDYYQENAGIVATAPPNDADHFFQGRNKELDISESDISTGTRIPSRASMSTEPRQSSAHSLSEVVTQNQHDDNAASSTACPQEGQSGNTNTNGPDENIKDPQDSSKIFLSDPKAEKMHHGTTDCPREIGQVPPENYMSTKENNAHPGSSKTVTLWELAARESQRACEDTTPGTPTWPVSAYATVQNECDRPPWDSPSSYGCELSLEMTMGNEEHWAVPSTPSLLADMEGVPVPGPGPLGSPSVVPARALHESPGLGLA